MAVYVGEGGPAPLLMQEPGKHMVLECALNKSEDDGMELGNGGAGDGGERRGNGDDGKEEQGEQEVNVGVRMMEVRQEYISMKCHPAHCEMAADSVDFSYVPPRLLECLNDGVSHARSTSFSIHRSGSLSTSYFSFQTIPIRSSPPVDRFQLLSMPWHCGITTPVFQPVLTSIEPLPFTLTPLYTL